MKDKIINFLFSGNDIHNYCDQDLIINYTVISPSLIQKLNKL